MEDRHCDAEVRCVRGAEIGMVVDDDVAVLDLALKLLHEAADVERQRPDMHRRGLALAELAPVRAEDAAADVLRLADDA